MYSEVVTVTPQLAAEWLKRNTDNRPLRKWHVEALAGAITRGEWVLSHQGVAFAEDGRLLDGQHRLAAIVKANTSVLMVVTRNVPEDAFKAIDQGVKRTLSDVFGVDARVIESVRLATTIFYTNLKTTPQRVKEIGDSGLMDVLSDLISFCGTKRKYFSSAPMRLGAGIRIMQGQDPMYVKTQYRSLATCDIESMSAAGRSLLSQVQNGVASAKRSDDTLVRALAVFDVEKQGNQKIQVKPESRTIAYQVVRNVISQNMRGA